jgi:uncharacterized protein YwgA
MSNPRRKLKHSPPHEHVWEKEERTLEDGFSYYYWVCKVCDEVVFPGPQLENLFNYAKANVFLFVEDWVLLLLYAGIKHTMYIAGITQYQKMLFLIYKEFIPKYKIPSENPGFYGYLYGPFSARIDAAVNFLIQRGYIRTEGLKSSSTEHFIITEKGEDRGKEIFEEKLSSKEQREALQAFREKWDKLGTRAICKYIYSNPEYEEYIKNSIILSRLFPGRKLYRRRGTWCRSR